jgi:hypothetical protein
MCKPYWWRDIVFTKANCFSLSTSKGYTVGIKLKSRAREDAGQHKAEYPIDDEGSSDFNGVLRANSSDSVIGEEENGDNDSGSDSDVERESELRRP